MRTAALLLCAVLLLSACLGGRVILTNEDRRQAVAQYEEAARREPDDWLVQRRLGQLRFDLEEYALAETSFSRALALSPGEPVSLLYLGLARIGKGDREAGLELLATYRWPGKYFHQKYVQEEAQRLKKHPEEPARELIRDILDALEKGRREQDQLDYDMLHGISDR